jgi:hypothetical protein
MNGCGGYGLDRPSDTLIPTRILTLGAWSSWGADFLLRGGAAGSAWRRFGMGLQTTAGGRGGAADTDSAQVGNEVDCVEPAAVQDRSLMVPC